jgi:hypothetical protein
MHKCRPTTHFLHKVRSPNLSRDYTTSGVDVGFERGMGEEGESGTEA